MQRPQGWDFWRKGLEAGSSSQISSVWNHKRTRLSQFGVWNFFQQMSGEGVAAVIRPLVEVMISLYLRRTEALCERPASRCLWRGRGSRGLARHQTERHETTSELVSRALAEVFRAYPYRENIRGAQMRTEAPESPRRTSWSYHGNKSPP